MERVKWIFNAIVARPCVLNRKSTRAGADIKVLKIARERIIALVIYLVYLPEAAYKYSVIQPDSSY